MAKKQYSIGKAGEQLLTELLEKRKVLLDAMCGDTEAANDEYLIVGLQKVHASIKLVWELIAAESQGDEEAIVKKTTEVAENFIRTQQELTQICQDWARKLKIS